MHTTPTLAPWRSRGYLPHFDEAGAVQALTFRLADSLPRELLFRRLEGLSPEEKARHYQLLDDYLDSGKGACWLARPEIADLMQGTLMHFDSERYRLLAWVVMPNHVHVVIETFAEHPVSKVMHSWKGYSASQANKILDRTGQFWMVEYHDRKVRDETHLHKAIRYIEYNPVRARLAAREVDWPYSSARHRGRIPV